MRSSQFAQITLVRMRRWIAHVLAGPLRRYARGRPRGPADRVTFLLMHAWGMGGTIRVTLDIAGRLAAQHDVEVLSIVRRRDDPFFMLPPGVTVTAVDDQREGRVPPLGRLLRLLPSVLMPHGDAHAAGPCTLWTDVCLARALRRLPGGVVIGTRPGLTALALDVAAPGVKVAGHEHMHLSAHPEPLRRMITSRYPRLDALIVLTRADRDEFAAALDGSGVPIVRIPNATRDLGGPAPALENRLILAAGRLGNQKGFDMLIQAFAQVNARHPDWQLRICGDGPHARRLRRLTARLGLSGRVAFPGASAALGEEFARASMFVLSSRFEGFPLVLVEAMHKGLPVVSFDCPTGPGEIVEDRRNGILVPARDVDALARGMIALIEDPELRRRCGAEAARTAEAYRMDVIGPRWDAFIADLLAREPAPRRGRSRWSPSDQAALTRSSSVGSS
jgi:glycosyltransferase involved in cell wall biosynthesis